MQYLDSARPSIVQPIDNAPIATARFVQVEVAKVENPDEYALSFNVDFRDPDGNVVGLWEDAPGDASHEAENR